MQIYNIAFQLLLCMSLLVPVANAENLSVPDKEHRQGMSYEEYSHYREKMRLHMDKMHPQDPKQAPAPSNPTPEQTDKLNPNSAYGQGYHSRERTEDRPDRSIDKRSDRPNFERFNRGDMGRH